MPRKGENIYKRKDGRWEGRIIECYDSFGKAKYKSFYADSYFAVKEKIKAFSPICYMKPAAINGKNVTDYSEKWLNTVKMKCKISTYNKYRSICKNHILPVVGNSSVETITAEQVEIIACSKTHLSSKTQNDILCVTKMILEYAQSCGCNITNVNGLTIRQENKQMRVLSLTEQKILTNYLLKDTDLCKIGVYLSLCTGIRIGELCALKRENISFESNLLSVRGTMQRVQIDGEKTKTKVIISEPKSRKSIRDIPLPDFICGFFGQYYQKLPQGAYLLTGRTDKFIEPRLLEYRFKNYIKACKLYGVNFHALRHPYVKYTTKIFLKKSKIFLSSLKW